PPGDEVSPAMWPLQAPAISASAAASAPIPVLLEGAREIIGHPLHWGRAVGSARRTPCRSGLIHSTGKRELSPAEGRHRSSSVLHVASRALPEVLTRRSSGRRPGEPRA